MGFLSSLFSSSKKEDTSSEEKPKEDLKNFDILKYDGIRAMQMRQVGYAIKCFQKALEIQSDFETMSHLISAYTMTDNSESALEVVDQMIIMEPDDVNSLLARVNILFHLDRDIEVISTCDKAIELEPDNHIAWFLRAKAKHAIKNHAEAIEDVSQAITLKEDFAGGFLLRSEIYLLVEDGEKALEDVNMVISLVEEGEESAHLLRGRIYELLGNVEDAANEYREVLDLNPFNEQAYLLAGKLMTTLQKYDEAMAIYDEAIEHVESFAKAYTMRGKLKELTGDKQGAEEDLRMATELEPEDGEEDKTGQADFDNMYKGGIF